MRFSTRQLSGCLFLAAALAAGGALAQAAVPLAPAASASQPQRATRPLLPPRASAEDCRKRRTEYERSQACYARYRTVNGMRPEAFALCGPELPDPSAECGAPSTP